MLSDSTRIFRFLVVEDNPDDIDLIRLELGGIKATIEILTTYSLSELESLDLKTIDVVISDYNLQSFNGLKVIESIRSRDSLLPIVIISGTVGEETAVDLLAAGANDFVLKSNLRKLKSAIIRVITEANLEKEKAQYQRELIEKNHLLDTMFNTFEELVFLKNASGRYLKVNQAFCDFLELNERDILGKKSEELFHYDDPDFEREQDLLIVKTRNSVTYETIKTNNRGQKFTFEISKRPIISNQEVSGILGSARNITQRKLLVENAERVQFILNQAERLTESGSFEYDCDADIMHCSVNFLRIFGLEGSSISFRKFSNMVKSEDRPLFSLGVNEAIRKKKEYHQVHRFVVPGAAIRTFKVFLRPDHRVSNTNIFFGTIIDETSDQVSSIYLMEKMEEEKKEIARELHDNIGQKLNGISMYISKSSKPNLEAAELLKIRETLHAAIDDLSSIMNTISVKHIEEHDIDYAISRLLEFLPPEMEVKKDIYMEEARVSSFIKAQIYRIIQEVIHNAVKYSKASKLEVKIKEEGGIISLLLKDNGVGFDMATLRKGNGLKNIIHRVKKTNGFISVESEKDQGTRFVIRMPLN